MARDKKSPGKIDRLLDELMVSRLTQCQHVPKAV